MSTIPVTFEGNVKEIELRGSLKNVHLVLVTAWTRTYITLSNLIIQDGTKCNSVNGLLRTVVLVLDSYSLLCNIMAYVMTIAKRIQNCMSNGFHYASSYGGEDAHLIGVLVTNSRVIP